MKNEEMLTPLTTLGAIDNVGAIAQAQASAAAPPKPASMFNLFKKAPLGQEVCL